MHLTRTITIFAGAVSLTLLAGSLTANSESRDGFDGQPRIKIQIDRSASPQRKPKPKKLLNQDRDLRLYQQSLRKQSIAQLKDRVRKLNGTLASPRINAIQRQILTDMRNSASNELRRKLRARRQNNNRQRQAGPDPRLEKLLDPYIGRLNDKQLRKRQRAIELAIANRQFDRDQQQRAKRLSVAISRELTSRRDARLQRKANRQRQQQQAQKARDFQTMKYQAKKQARRILNDQRDPNRMSDADLRNRIASIRQLLRNPALRSSDSRSLREVLARDRKILRNRVAEANNRPVRDAYRPAPEQIDIGVLELLDDRRGSRDLSDRQLRRRIKRILSVLDGAFLRPGQRRDLRDMLSEDRAEKRRRLLVHRRQRQRELARSKPKRPKFEIILSPRISFGINRTNDIAAAEADDERIGAYLTAPVKRKFKRRYTLNEVRRNPSITRQMPGVDLDTIRFGFNEAFIREEEIDELDTIARFIEQQLAYNPDEVFQLEGHTDAVGSAAYNYRLSLARAKAVKHALTKFFVIPSRALVTVGFGEDYLKIPTPEAEAENRRVTIRRITPLLYRR